MSFLDDIGISSLLPNPFGLPSQGVWNLQKGSFSVPGAGLFGLSALGNEVVFYVENAIGQVPNQLTAMDTINDTGGRRLAVYEFPFIDGQQLADLGRKGEKFTFNIKFFGENYQILFKEFIEIVTKSNKKGTLTHPVRGTFPARFLEWDYVHRHDEWNAVTIRATFLEDNTDQVSQLNIFDSINSILRSALQTLSTIQSTILSFLNAAIALLNLPQSLLNQLKNDLKQVIAQVSQLLAQLAATFSTDSQTQTVFANAVSTGSATNVNSGTVQATTANPTGQLPPVYQVGFSPADQANISKQLSTFVAANKITPQQALFGANSARSTITTAIKNVTAALGNAGFNAVLQYRILAVQVQNVTQAAISNIQTQVILYTVPQPMSLRMVAFKNGLSPDRQNDIENLNPYLTSVNWILPGTVIQVPSH